jgi:hypothetical protein
VRQFGVYTPASIKSEICTDAPGVSQRAGVQNKRAQQLACARLNRLASTPSRKDGRPRWCGNTIMAAGPTVGAVSQAKARLPS